MHQNIQLSHIYTFHTHQMIVYLTVFFCFKSRHFDHVKIVSLFSISDVAVGVKVSFLLWFSFSVHYTDPMSVPWTL